MLADWTRWFILAWPAFEPPRNGWAEVVPEGIDDGSSLTSGADRIGLWRAEMMLSKEVGMLKGDD